MEFPVESQELRKSYQRKWALRNPQELQEVKKRIVSVFMVDKPSRKNCRSTKDTVIKSLTPLEVKPQRMIKGRGYFVAGMYCYPHLPTVRTSPVAI